MIKAWSVKFCNWRDELVMKDFWNDPDLGASSSDFEFKRPLFKTSKISHLRIFCNDSDQFRSNPIKQWAILDSFVSLFRWLNLLPLLKILLILPKIDHFWTRMFQKREFYLSKNSNPFKSVLTQESAWISVFFLFLFLTQITFWNPKGFSRAKMVIWDH